MPVKDSEPVANPKTGAENADPKWLVSVAVGDWLIIDAAGNVFACPNAKFADLKAGKVLAA
jgi:hypothetical protein